MSIAIKKRVQKKRRPVKPIKKSMSARRKRAIEQAIQFWERHALDLGQFKFDREEANAR